MRSWRKMTWVLGAALVLALVMTNAAPAEITYPLTYKRAKKAANARADREASPHNARITHQQRTGKRRFYVQAEWSYTDPHGCKDCGYDPDTGQFYNTPTTVDCWVEINVSRSKRTGKVFAKLDGKTCY